MCKNKLPNHLGGHLNTTHIDECVLNYLKKNFSIKSMLDVGCGPGGMVDLANNIGIHAYGVDGDFTLGWANKDNFFVHDYTCGPFHFKNVDIIWCVEFLEHVSENFLDNVFGTFACAPYICCTAAAPGYSGHHHVNCKDQQYWETIFGNRGFVLNEEITSKIRAISSMKRDFIKRTGMFFEKRDRRRYLHVGCGNVYIKNYEHLDLCNNSFIDYNMDLNVFFDKFKLLNTYSKIYSRHWLEHLTSYDAEHAIHIMHELLLLDGEVELILPDLEFHARQLLMGGPSEFVNTSNFDHAMAGFYGWQSSKNPYMQHNWGYTKASLDKLLQRHGFMIESIQNPRACDMRALAKKIKK